MLKIQIKNRFTGVIIFEYSKENNTIAETVKEALSKKVVLRYADLRSADLRSADLDKRYIQIGRIGSEKRLTTYCFEDNIIWCGCFTGTLEEFEERVKETHANNKQYMQEYLGFIEYLKSLK